MRNAFGTWLFAFAMMACTGNAVAGTLRIDGEVYARRSSALMPPSVDDVWQFNIVQLAPDGSVVGKGDVVVAFDSSQVIKQLTEKQSLLKEKQTQYDKLRLELAERARDEHLSTAEALSNQDKAQRKTQQPPELIAGIQYRKLEIARAQSERKLALAGERERLAGEQRRQEQRLLASEVGQLQAEVTRLQRSLSAMNVIAPRAGMMMHKSGFSGEKFDVGSQAWRGQSVAEIPDPSSLAVRAQLPERDLLRARVGAPVRVVVEGGGGGSLGGTIESIGNAVRSKSQVQPIPVLDLEIGLVGASHLKPGQAVRVELSTPGTTGSTVQ
jgi:HlyD family secretion protein